MRAATLSGLLGDDERLRVVVAIALGASLRRYPVDESLLTRAGGMYRRT
jgi:hypothetical protein